MSSEIPLFLPDEDDDDMQIDAGPSTSTANEAPQASSSSKGFAFFASSDDNRIALSTEDAPQLKADDDSDIELLTAEEPPRQSSPSSATSNRPPVEAARAQSVESIQSLPPPTKKRKLSPERKQPAPDSFYIGSLIVGNAYSTAKGKGYIKIGDEVRVERDQLEEVKVSKKAKPTTTAKNGKQQISISTMFKPPPPKISQAKKNKDRVIRLSNDRDFGTFLTSSTTPTVSSSSLNRVWTTSTRCFFVDVEAHGSWYGFVLPDARPSLSCTIGIIEFKGSTMIDCPTNLHSGADLIVNLSVYIQASAFKPPNSLATDREGNAKVMFNEGQETEVEQSLRERKVALLKLFDALNLRPSVGQAQPTEVDESMVTRPKKHTKIEIVGDGEEIEVEEGEELKHNDLDMIYQK
jgi:DNA repair protein RAD5